MHGWRQQYVERIEQFGDAHDLRNTHFGISRVGLRIPNQHNEQELEMNSGRGHVLEIIMNRGPKCPQGQVYSCGYQAVISNFKTMPDGLRRQATSSSISLKLSNP